ncbi:hypothetical protein [Pseudomonas aeruginosa]|uniref:hypothetical protein n=1 Tax=Pseudomonas aeruginosa TaxID=287 RepID=UPI001372EDDF|nr:hypothetical protein [Pseudomonas aeruginosa]NBK56512.1 hypothetical protein [Pseudomonas aeruginosa]
MSSTQHQLIEQCATRLRGIVEALDNIHDNTPHRWSTDLDDVHSSAESLLAMIKDQAPARSEASFEEWLANELEGEDGQPVPAAVCDITLARRAFNHWPKLEQPAKVGGVRFSAGVSSRLVVEAAQRLYEFESTPEKEAERIERLQAFREQCFEPLGKEFSKVLSENLVELSSDAKPEQAEAERPALWAVHAQGPDELYAGFSREDAEKHAAELNALPMPEGIAVGAVVVPSPWPEAEHWKYLAEQERDHKNEITGRLRQLERICEGLPQDAIDGGWTVQGIRGYAKRLEDQLKAALARVAELEKQEPVATVAKVPGEDWNSLDFHRDLQHMQPGTKLYAAPVARAQHSVPEEFIGRLSEFLAQRGATGKALLRELRAMLAAAPGKEAPQAWIDVQAERRRQVENEGWTPEHDDEHSHGQIARAAACYALAGSSAPNDGTAALLVSLAWPWDQQWWKPSTARRDLVKAGALVLAEIERLDRTAATQGGPRDA